eukprot:m.54107 g.54107  ORF g.54107 m.54107 type:complete len:506 (+) comp13603_c0_seq8:218-1735(+)
MLRPDRNRTVYYRSSDPVRNFKLRVVVRRVTAALLVGNGLDNQDAASLAPQQRDERLIGWQEKIFSEAEIERYQDASQCYTLQDEAYHAQVTALLDNRPAAGLLYTYADVDDYHAHAADDTLAHGAPVSTPLQQRMTQARHRRGNRAQALRKQRSEQHSAPVTADSDGSNHVLDTPFQVMYVMASLADEKGQQRRDYVLACIKYDVNGVLHMAPDFTRDRLPYRLETPWGHLYEFELHHASHTQAASDAQREDLLLRELALKQANLVKQRVGNVFAPAPKGKHAMRLHVAGSLDCVCDVRSEPVYVTVTADLPVGWRWSGGQGFGVLSSQLITPTSRGEAFLGLPLDMTAVWSPSETDAESTSPCPPQTSFRVVVEVNSLSSWGSRRLEGYALLHVPTTAGRHVLNVQTWRPSTGHVTDELRRFFVGGAVELDDPSSLGVPAGHLGSVSLVPWRFACSLSPLMGEMHETGVEQVWLEERERTECNSNLQCGQALVNWRGSCSNGC